METITASAVSHATPLSRDDARLFKVAQELEASFLAEMLSHAGLGDSRESFGGGAGEEAFSSLLTGEQAKLMTEAGGIGLAEAIFNAIRQRDARE